MYDECVCENDFSALNVYMHMHVSVCVCTYIHLYVCICSYMSASKRQHPCASPRSEIEAPLFCVHHHRVYSAAKGPDGSDK